MTRYISAVLISCIFLGWCSFLTYSDIVVVSSDNLAYYQLEELVIEMSSNTFDSFAVSEIKDRVPIVDIGLEKGVVISRLVKFEPHILDIIAYHINGKHKYHYINVSGERKLNVCKMPC